MMPGEFCVQSHIHKTRLVEQTASVAVAAIASVCLMAALTTAAIAQEKTPAEKKMSLGEAAEKALQQSQLTLAGGAPFHLKASIADVNGTHPEYKAEVEEYWVSPGKWRRTIHSAGFSQTIIVNGDKTAEDDGGDYYPYWLHNLATAIFDPLPMLGQLKRVPAELELPQEDKSTSCVNFSTPGNNPKVAVSSDFSFCFQDRRALLQIVSTPGYKAHFENFKTFGGRQVPYRITEDLQPGLTLVASISELSPLKNVDEEIFTIDAPTTPDHQIRSTQVVESTARSIAANTPEPKWPAVREGRTNGTASVYLSADRTGHVHEVWPLTSDNPEITEALQEQLKHWQFKPYVNGYPLQMEAVFAFAFTTQQGAPIPLLNNVEARKLARRMVEPKIAAGAAVPGGIFTVRVRVDEQGRTMAVMNVKKVKPALYEAAVKALRQWEFKPYAKDGKVDRFDADLIFKTK
jgi:outer membrane biosynthesis protein TonB